MNERVEDFAALRISCAAKVAALADALRGIPRDLAPCRRASLVALREQVYFGWEQPLARARGARLIFGKYEADGWWSEAAAALVGSGAAVRGTRQLERDHVEPVSQIVADLLEVPRSAAETAALLEERLVTCTVLAEEHRRLGRTEAVGWARYDAAAIRYRLGLAPEPPVWDERNGPEDFDADSGEAAQPDSISSEDRLQASDATHPVGMQGADELEVSDTARSDRIDDGGWGPDDLEFRSSIDGDLHLVLPAGQSADGWKVAVVKANGDREVAPAEWQGAFSYYYTPAAWWYVEHLGAAHVEVTAPDGTTAIRHHARLTGPAEDCPACNRRS
jgi:hypothetical protein